MEKLYRMLLTTLLFLPLAGAVASCSEQTDEETDEYANWQQRNEQYVETLSTKYQRLKNYTKDQQAEGAAADYIYYEVLEQGRGSTDSPLFTDSVRISYRGRLIPTTNYPEGYVFDQTFAGTFSWQTTSTITGPASGFVEGFTTALLHMHTGDRWRIYIPHQLGYGTTDKTSIPAYSTLVFDLALVDFRHQGQKLPTWNARRAQ
jgi:FKBP-type peptidyl-prolyl cis-trans isomerase FklB